MNETQFIRELQISSALSFYYFFYILKQAQSYLLSIVELKIFYVLRKSE